MGGVDSLLELGAPTAGHRPWPRTRVAARDWQLAGERLAAGEVSLLGLWADEALVHMALYEAEPRRIGVLSVDAASGHFPSIGVLHPPAQRLERAIRDLFGLEAEGAADTRPWLDHGKWGDGAPRESYRFLPVEGESLHQIPVGPVHAGIIEPGHFRFTANGETVVRLEARLGYVHKGIERLMCGADLERASMLAGRVSGDSAVAYALAFARAAEAALGIEAPPRAHWLRALMAELERLANHFGDMGAICNDAAFALMHTHCGALRERALRAADASFGHRLMRDRIVPGGLAADLSPEGARAIAAFVTEARRRFPALVALYDGTASLLDRTVGTGRVSAELAAQFAAGGYVGRASGRRFDARLAASYPPYDALSFDVKMRSEGDVNARVWVRIREVEASLDLVDEVLRRLPDGPVRTALPRAGAAEGMALVEGFRGDVLVWLRLGAAGEVARCHLRDPSWFQWPLLEAAIEGNIVADFPLCNKSFNCSYSGHDL
jgi:Ni,Fe-hydrogenase III large subunit